MLEIPRKIHYVWLGSAPLPAAVKDCIKSWEKYMPDYSIKCWNEENFDINSVPWVKEAIQQKMWAFASDYIRLYALYTEGGIYLDTDVKVFRNLNGFLSWDFFSAVEFHPNLFETIGKYQERVLEGKIIDVCGMGILAACMGAKAQNVFIRECMDFYESHHFIREDGSLYTDIINPTIIASIAVRHGFKYCDMSQLLDNNMMIYDSSVLAGDPRTRTSESYIVHYCDNSWMEQESFWRKIKLLIKHSRWYKHK